MLNRFANSREKLNKLFKRLEQRQLAGEIKSLDIKQLIEQLKPKLEESLMQNQSSVTLSDLENISESLISHEKNESTMDKTNPSSSENMVQTSHPTL